MSFCYLSSVFLVSAYNVCFGICLVSVLCLPSVYFVSILCLACSCLTLTAGGNPRPVGNGQTLPFPGAHQLVARIAREAADRGEGKVVTVTDHVPVFGCR